MTHSGTTLSDQMLLGSVVATNLVVVVTAQVSKQFDAKKMLLKVYAKLFPKDAFEDLFTAMPRSLSFKFRYPKKLCSFVYVFITDTDYKITYHNQLNIQTHSVIQ
jgi:hypothetical protein